MMKNAGNLPQGSAASVHAAILIPKPRTGRPILRTARQQRFFLIALLPFIAYAVIFFYYPMYGVLIAFKNFSYAKGIIGSP